jgi:hypothetical protein
LSIAVVEISEASANVWVLLGATVAVFVVFLLPEALRQYATRIATGQKRQWTAEAVQVGIVGLVIVVGGSFGFCQVLDPLRAGDAFIAGLSVPALFRGFVETGKGSFELYIAHAQRTGATG